MMMIISLISKDTQNNEIQTTLIRFSFGNIQEMKTQVQQQFCQRQKQ
ncbi:unnamed protein product [Paramecium octaurelia]|uniref:Uncharacterized protein n=1 Tax=Paramecium octaurelia TaxID=43137 RepID=A0A8S1SVP2_PAROT|nr:unnamed protein product [Paramecium octaurelia]